MAHSYFLLTEYCGRFHLQNVASLREEKKNHSFNDPVTYFRVSTVVSIRGENVCSEWKVPVRKSNTRIKGSGERFEGPSSTFAPDALGVLTEWRGRPISLRGKSAPQSPALLSRRPLASSEHLFPGMGRRPVGVGLKEDRTLQKAFCKAQ